MSIANLTLSYIIYLLLDVLPAGVPFRSAGTQVLSSAWANCICDRCDAFQIGGGLLRTSPRQVVWNGLGNLNSSNWNDRCLNYEATKPFQRLA